KASSASQLRDSPPDASSPVFTQALRMSVRSSSVESRSMVASVVGMLGPPGSGVDGGADLAGEALEDRHHVVEVAIARFEEEGADAEVLVAPNVGDDLIGRALQRLALRAVGSVADREPHAKGDGEVVDPTVDLLAFGAEPRDVALESVRRRERGMPAVAQLGHATQGPRGMAAHPDGDGLAHRLGHHTDLVEGEEFP